MTLLSANGELTYAGADVGQKGVPQTSPGGSLPEPAFIADAADTIVDLFVHGAGLAQRWFILTGLGDLYACGDNTDGICTGGIAGPTPTANAVWARISFVL